MLLRRITQHFKDQNWFAVALDFFIVIIGVFMGFQVQAWNENRKDAAAASFYIERLATDMEIAIAENKATLEHAERRAAQTKLIIRALESCTLASEDREDFTTGLYNLGKYNLPAIVTSTIDELNATGKFHLIGDAELQRKIIDNVRHHERIKSIDPQLAGRTISSVNYVSSKVRFTLDTFLFPGTKVYPDNAIYDFDELCADQTFINAIATVRRTTLATTKFSQATLSRQIEVRDALYAKLGVSQMPVGNK